MSYLKKELATHPELRFNKEQNSEFIDRWEELDKSKSDMLNQQLELKGRKSGHNEHLKQEVEVVEKELHKLENDLRLEERKLEKLGDEFVFSAKEQETQLPFPINPSFNLPTERLPKVGILYRNGKLRQLAIKDKIELDAGEKEAERLNALLVLEVK
jgi:hypothetical protein